MSKLVPYLGGKKLLTKTILSLLPEHRLYCEPFAGSATILLEKVPSPAEVINDINGEIVNLFRIVQTHQEEFLRCIRWNLRSRQEFLRLKNSLPAMLTDIQRAARLYYLMRAGYSGIGKYFSGKIIGSHRPFSIYRIEETLYEIHLRLENVTIEHLPYADCIGRYDGPDALFYLDPPYYGCENYYGAGIFAREDFTSLAALLRQISGRFLLSLNDTPEVRLLFAGFPFLEVSTSYTSGTHCGHDKKARELLIANYDLSQASQKAT
jgi:DNA adenine methylase